jgi:glutathione S-transferase
MDCESLAAATRPLLYSYKRCPYAIRARIALALSGVEVELREVSLRDKPAHLLKVSPKGTVPVLFSPSMKIEEAEVGGTVIDESREIMQWALRKNDPLELLRVDEATALENATLIDRFDGTFKFHLDRYKYPYRYKDKGKDKEECDVEAEAEAEREKYGHRAECMSILRELEEKLLNDVGEGGWMGGTRPCFADIAVLPFVRQFRIADEKYFDVEVFALLPTVHAWLSRFQEWPVFHKVMGKYATWQPGDPIVLFNPLKDEVR